MKKLKTLLAATASLLLSAGMLSACSSSENKAEEFVVGFDQEYPPYGYVANDGSYTGFDLELAQEVAKRNNWTYKATPIDWDAKDAQLNSGAITAIWNGFTMEGREGQYAFSQPYMLNEQVIVVKADSAIKELNALAGKNVITQADSAALNVLQDAEGKKSLADTFAKLETIGDYNNAFMQLESGMVDAVACDSSIAAYQMSANEGKYVIIEEPLSSEHYAVGFKKGDDERAKKVTETLIQLDSEGFVKKLCEKYADQGISYNNWTLKKTDANS
ncbi:MAG: transporter substrate-binding domain-containing protein [Actinomycetaceae bacterium]|nr:transporter substrate-binding domain-containing protein [Actinomycetaceae bacterium]